MPKKPIQFLSQSPVTELTDKHYKYIGEIVFKHSYIEYIIKTMVYEAVGVEQSVGRLAIRAARTEEMLNDFEDICQIRGFSVQKTALAKIKKDCKLLKSRRDILAHSIWLEKSEEVAEPHDYMVLLTGGSLPKLISKEIGTKKRKIRPQGAPISLKNLKEMADFAERVRKSIEEYFKYFAKHNQDKLVLQNIAIKSSSAKTSKE